MHRSTRLLLVSALGLLSACGDDGGRPTDAADGDGDVVEDVDTSGEDVVAEDAAEDEDAADAPADEAPDVADGDGETTTPGGLGDPCAVPADCAGGLCITGALFPGFDDGYCTQLGCDPAVPDSCGAGGGCVAIGGSFPTFCVRTCDAVADCATGQDCVGMCIPGSFVTEPTPTTVLDPSDATIGAVIAALDQTRMQSRIAILSGAAPWDSPGGPVTIHSRAVGHPDHGVALDYLEAELTALGLTSTRLPFTTDAVDYVNLEAVLPGSNPALEPLHVTAHYDSTASSESVYDPAVDPAPGANDNASGSAILLELAEILSTMAATSPAPRTIVFLLFDGEEDGLLGSVDYVADMTAAGSTLLCDLNVDMVGWNPDLTLDRFWYVYDVAHESVAEFDLEAVADFVPAAIPIPSASELWADSDHASYWGGGFCGTSMSTFPPEAIYHTFGDVLDAYDWPIFLTVARSAAAIATARAYRY